MSCLVVIITKTCPYDIQRLFSAVKIENFMGEKKFFFGTKIRKIGIPLHTPVLLYKSGVYGVYITQTCFTDVPKNCFSVINFLLPFYIISGEK